MLTICHTPGMARLDYAFLADYAQVEGGKLSAIGASYTHARISDANALWVTSIAGRVQTTQDADPIELGIRIVAPGELFEIAQTAVLEVGNEARPYAEGKVGVLFANTVALPVVEGLFEIYLTLDGEQVRRLAFDVVVDS